jgi:hypothetical protein
MGSFEGRVPQSATPAARRMTIMALDGEHHDETLRHIRDGAMDCPPDEQGLGLARGLEPPTPT